MKKISTRTLALVLVAVLALSGCAKATDKVTTDTVTKSNALYKAGTYVGKAQGHNGEMELEVSFDDNAITAINVISHKETAGISDPAFAKIPQAIIDNQSLAVDAISGCTVSSKGILAAVEDAVTQAGGDSQALKDKKIESAAPGEAIVKTADVVIVGGGGAGISAATAAAKAGASVILVEKTAALGGNTLASGLAWNAADPEVEGKLDAIDGQVDTLKAVLDYNESDFGEFADTLKTLKGQIKEYLAGDTSKMFDSTEWHTIQTYLGGKRQDIKGNTVQGSYELITTLTGKSLETYHWLAETTGLPTEESLSSPVGSMWKRGHHFAKKTDVFEYPTKFIEEHNGEIMLDTKVEELVITGDRVTGVKAVMTDGTPVELTATKGVIITTGGFAANEDMVREYNTYWPSIPEGIKTTCVASATGDGIALGQQAKAALVDMGLVQLMPTASALTGALADGLLVAPQNYVFVNKEGKRFVNEYAARDTLTFAALEQTDGTFFTIDDQEMVKTVQNKLTQEQIDAMVEKGILLKADTLEGLAEQIGCDPKTLIDTIDTYNSYVDNKKDPDFGKNAFEMKVEKGPFYACPSKPSVHHTMGGLKINANAEVLNEQGQAIPGLYAAGEVTGGVHAGNRLGGNAIADAFVFGRIAGENAAK